MIGKMTSDEIGKTENDDAAFAHRERWGISLFFASKLWRSFVSEDILNFCKTLKLISRGFEKKSGGSDFTFAPPLALSAQKNGLLRGKKAAHKETYEKKQRRR
jgi:hypothetical protein